MKIKLGHRHRPSARLLMVALILATAQTVLSAAATDTTSNNDAAQWTDGISATGSPTPAADQQPQQQRQNSDIVIKSLEDGLLDGTIRSSTGDRHHYDQQASAAEPQASTSVSAKQVVAATDDIAELTSTGSNSKPEPRNEEERPQDPVIIDHRPNGLSIEPQPQQASGRDDFGGGQQQQPTTTQSPQAQQLNMVAATVPPSSYQHYIAPTTSPAAAQNTQTSQPTASINWYPAAQQTQQQPQQTANIMNYPQQHQHQQHHSVAAQTTSGQQQQSPASYSGPMVSAASQPAVTIQHPTSINAIIQDHQSQQQQQQQQTQPMASQQQPQQSQVVSVNGQPMILVNPNAVSGGRRISISGWLRGISSMLANIFNRREHGAQSLAGVQSTLMPASSSPLGHWLQLGPNAPHWLSQAQAAIHQQQLQHQQLLGSASTTRYAFIPAPQQQQQQQSATMPTMTITMQPASTAVLGQASSGYQPAGDLQASGSSLSFVASPSSVQAPNQQSNGNNQQQMAIAQYNQPAGAGSQLVAVQQSPQTTTMQRQTAPVADQARQGGAVASNGSQPWPSSQQQQQQQQQSPQTNNQPTSSRPRFGRSSSSTLASSQSLPLAHYSHYGAD